MNCLANWRRTKAIASRNAFVQSLIGNASSLMRVKKGYYRVEVGLSLSVWQGEAFVADVGGQVSGLFIATSNRPAIEATGRQP